MESKNKQIQKRKRRVRLKLKKVTNLPQLSVFRSNRYIYAQIIGSDGKILAAASDIKLSSKTGKIEQAAKIGKEIAQKALKVKIKKVVFDRGPYKYHGRVKMLAEGARKAGLKF